MVNNSNELIIKTLIKRKLNLDSKIQFKGSFTRSAIIPTATCHWSVESV